MEKYSPYSGMKVFYHTDTMAELIKGNRTAPVYVRIKPTNVCNQNCCYCAYANNKVFEDRKVNKRESIPWERLKQVLVDFSEMNVKAVTFSGGGEPLTYHSISQALELTNRLGIDYSMITNGQALEGDVINYLKHAKWVRVSFDSADKNTYESIRGIKTYDRVAFNIENFARKKEPTCILGINCVVSKQNAQEIYQICELVKKLGAENIKLSPVIVKENKSAYHDLIKETVCEQIIQAKNQLEDSDFHIIDKYTDEIAVDDNFQKSYHRCYIQEIFTVIAADSKVYRCHQRAYTLPGEIGDLSLKSFKEIWYSPETIKSSRDWDACEQCSFRCAFEERNILLNDFMSMDKNHINFI